MATLETIQASFDRFEREQKARDNVLLRTFDIMTNEVKRLQQMQTEHDDAQHMTMDMGDFMRMIAMMLTRQEQLLEAMGAAADNAGWDEKDTPDPVITPPQGYAGP